MTRLPCVNVGVINPGPDWEARYDPALLRLQERIQLTAVTGEVAARAEQLANAHRARWVSGVRQLFADPAVEAILLAEPGWRGDWLLATAAAGNKSVLFAEPSCYTPDVLRRAQRLAAKRGTTLMPLLPLRWTPITMRLRELLATRLGPIERMRLDIHGLCRSVDGPTTAADALDWFRSLAAVPHSRIEIAPSQAARSHAFDICLPPSQASRAPLLCEIAASDPLEQRTSESEHPFCRIECRAGTAELVPGQRLEWTVHGDHTSESLSTDRSEIEVALDLFARRVVGGLIPVPDPAAVCCAQTLAEALQRVSRTGQSASVSDATIK